MDLYVAASSCTVLTAPRRYRSLFLTLRDRALQSLVSSNPISASMADADEDAIRGPSTESTQVETDLSDETQDFRLLNHLNLYVPGFRQAKCERFHA